MNPTTFVPSTLPSANQFMPTFSQTGGVGVEPPSENPPGACSRDKKIMNLQAQAEHKKKLMRDEYKKLKTDVKENPYLQSAIDEYEKVFAVDTRKIKALKTLLKSVNTIEDQKKIKREIAALEKNM
jgi:hypothetical protein